MKIKDILKNAIENLKQSGIEEASLKAKILLSHILGITKEKLIINGENEINDKISKL